MKDVFFSDKTAWRTQQLWNCFETVYYFISQLYGYRYWG